MKVLHRFEQEQRVATFVRERIGEAPQACAVNVLDNVLRLDVRTTIDGLERSLKTLNPLFR
ncbi:MAG: hypothetical protein OXB98_11295 [Bryobacterales bacterium]|nr:hypothetical protein [Bryobacterales bacterium]